MEGVKKLIFDVECVYHTANGSIAFDCKKRNGVHKCLLLCLGASYGTKIRPRWMFYEMSRFEEEKHEMTSAPDNDVIKLEIIADNMESIVLKATSIRKDGRKIVEYIGDEYIKITEKLV